VLAIDASQYASGAHCFQEVEITANGKTARATVVDKVRLASSPSPAPADLELVLMRA
jgi:hypothetical protein